MMSRVICTAFALSLSAAPALAGQGTGGEPKAFLRAGTDGYYVALVLDPPAAPGTQPSSVSAGVYRSGRLLTQTVRTGDVHGAAFSIPLGEPSAFGGDSRGLLVAVSSYPTNDPATPGAFAIPVAAEVQVSVNPANPSCDPSALAIQIASNPNRDPTPYEAARLLLIHEYARAHPPAVEAELRSERGVRKQAIRFAGAFQLPMLITECFVLVPGVGSGAYDLRLTFPPDAPVELRPALLKTGLSAATHRNAPFSLDAGQIGKRSIEENLDLGLQFGSSVSKDAAGVSTRSSKGAVDLRFAPLLNVLPLPRAGSNSIWFLTPFLFDARVSTGDVTKETLAQNRIAFGTDVEYRHYTSPTTFPTYQRWIVSFRNAADRDFKQAEWKGVIELQAVFAPLNRPLAWQEDTEDSQLDPTRDPKRITPALGVGWQIVPLVGGEIGHTWKNELQVAAIEKTKKVYRAYFGGTAAVDLTRYVTLSLREILYVRGESDSDRLHNYLLAKAEVPLAGLSATTAQAVFFSYERGGQPPFSTPDANALKLGYRLLWNGWAQQFR
jgi:hypothetical protein